MVMSKTASMRQLSPLDAKFLHVESATTSGHVGSLLILDPSTAPAVELTLDDLRDVLEPRLHLAAPLRQRLVTVPLSLGLPYWVDDPDFDIEFHLREIGLPAPRRRAAARRAGRPHPRPPARSDAAAVGDVPDPRARGRSPGDLRQGAPCRDRRRLRRRRSWPRSWTSPSSRASWSRRRSTGSPAALPSTLDLLGRGLAARSAQPLDIIRTLPNALAASGRPARRRPDPRSQDGQQPRRLGDPQRDGRRAESITERRRLHGAAYSAQRHDHRPPAVRVRLAAAERDQDASRTPSG